jgi:hypothetical protein
MTTKFVLLIIFMANAYSANSGSEGSRNAVAISFDSKNACQHAAQIMVDDSPDNMVWTAYCFSTDKPEHLKLHRTRHES